LLTCELTHTHGWAHYSLSLIQALRRTGVEVTVLAAQNSPPIAGVQVHPILPNTQPREPRFSLNMLAQIRRAQELLYDCHILHAAVELYAPLAAWVAGHRPLLITGHGSYVRWHQERRPPVSWLYRWAFRRARWVCVSRYTAKVAQAALPGISTTVINNGVDVERFNSLNAVKQPRPTVLAVGAVKARKGTLELVQTMATVRQRIPDAQCMIVGSLTAEPRYVERIRQAVRDLQLDNCVHLLGHVSESELMQWYGSAHVFALPSLNVGWKFEGYGLAHLEASAAGLPVIGTTDCGAADAIDDGLTGLLVPQAQVTKYLPEAIIRLLDNPTLAAQMGAAGRIKATRQTWDHVAGQMIALYNEIGGE
jgi:glycosyltransferase involved in cell wall biosynthesis